MDNLKLPAYPFTTYDTVSNGEGIQIGVHYTDQNQSGFSKLELASLMIAQGLMTGRDAHCEIPEALISQLSVSLAKAVLEEANK